MKRYLKGAKRFILHYWLAISLGMIATPKAIETAYEQRGYVAFGGEYIVLPTVVMIAYLAENIFYAVLDIIYDDKEGCGNDSRGNSTGDVEHYRRFSETDRHIGRSG